MSLLHNMCGIAGIISTINGAVNERQLKVMSDSLAHRGPDGDGLWINDERTAGLSHRRLAIIDLSPKGAQPMYYLSRYSIVYNGEIYNYKELRSELRKAGCHFDSESDTEVILAAYHFYQEDCVKYFDGMFAFAIWDQQKQELFCARDTFGEKPFYYFIDKNIFAFGSEMKALWAAGINKTPDEKMMVNYLSLGYVQSASIKSQTFFKEIFALPPAHIGLLSFDTMQFTVSQYRDLNKENTIKINEEEAAEKLNELLQSSIKKRLRSDVPVGCSLSGGIDSSTIAYFVNQNNKQEARGGFQSFSAVFPGFKKDESALINEISRQFNLKNNQITPTADGLLNDLEKLCYHQEEPFSSSSIYAQYKVYEMASQHGVKVLLDGQGADELLAGYTKYLHWYLQELAGQRKFKTLKNERLAFQKNNNGLHWGAGNVMAAYLPGHASLALEKREYKKIINSPFLSPQILNEIKGKMTDGIFKPVVTKLNDILYYNTMQTGLEELLRYADRNSMAHGTEVRLPFLNYELVNFIFSLPASLKIKDGFTKYILRKTMDGKLPGNILWNPVKTGFETPQKSWMDDRKLQNRIYESKEKLVKEKILKPSVLDQKLNPMDVHEAGNIDWRYLNLAQII